MKRKRRKPEEIAALREKIAILFHRKISYPDIASSLNISIDCLHSNLRYLKLKRRERKLDIGAPTSKRLADEMISRVLSEDFFENEGVNRAKKILGARLTEQIIGAEIIFYLDGRRANLIKISEAAGMIKK